MSDQNPTQLDESAAEAGASQSGRTAIPMTPRRRQGREEMLALKEARRRQLQGLPPEEPEPKDKPGDGAQGEDVASVPPESEEKAEDSLVRLKRGVMSGGGVAPPRFARRRRKRGDSNKKSDTKPRRSRSHGRWFKRLGRKFLRLDSLWLIPLAAVILIIAFQVLKRLPERGRLHLPDLAMFQKSPSPMTSKVSMPIESPTAMVMETPEKTGEPPEQEPSTATVAVSGEAGASASVADIATPSSTIENGVTGAPAIPPGKVPGLFRQAQALAEAGRIDEAINGMNQALALDPMFTPAVRALYSLHGMRNNPEQLIEFGRRLIVLEPGNTSLLLDIARRLDATGRSAEAVRLIDTHAGSAISDMQVLALKVQAMRKAGISEGEILDTYERDAPVGRDNPAADILLLILRDAAGRTDGITEAIEREATRIDTADLSKDPRMARLMVSLSVLAATHGLLELSERLSLAVIESGSPDAKFAANDLAYRLVKTGKRLDEAERLSRMALDADPGSEAFIDTMAVIQLKLGRPAEAIATFESRIDPARLLSPVARKTLAEAYRALGREEDASRLLDGEDRSKAP